MTKSELKRRIKQNPERYRICQITDDIQEKQYVTVNDNQTDMKVGLVIKINYPNLGQCVIDLDIEKRLNERVFLMQNSLMIFLGSLLSQAGKLSFETIVIAEDNKIKKEMTKIELSEFDLTFIGNDISDALKKLCQFFGNLQKISEYFLAKGELLTSAKKTLLDTAKSE